MESSDICALCHRESPSGLWGPNENLCLGCHQEKASINCVKCLNKTYDTWGPNENLCFGCHQENVSINCAKCLNKTYVTWGPNENLCLGCHQEEDPMKMVQFNKLIRNKLPIIMQKEGFIINSTTLSQDEYISNLKKKLIEEANEVSEANSNEELLIELADVMEVIHALAKANDLPLELIEEHRLRKLSINGTFDANNYVNYVEVEVTNKTIIDYLSNKKDK
jgi:predicted house-cleaning noncanonical NTP pyrophosphatase (MazG superfamily)